MWSKILLLKIPWTEILHFSSLCCHSNLYTSNVTEKIFNLAAFSKQNSWKIFDKKKKTLWYFSKNWWNYVLLLRKKSLLAPIQFFFLIESKKNFDFFLWFKLYVSVALFYFLVSLKSQCSLSNLSHFTPFFSFFPLLRQIFFLTSFLKGVLKLTN